MATEALLSTAITNAENIRKGATSDRTSTKLAGGKLRQSVGYVTMTAATTIGSTYRMVRLPAHARISKIVVKSVVGIVAALVDIGVYRTIEDGGAVVDADCYAAAFDIEAAAIDTTELNLRFSARGIATVEQAVWEDAGVTTAPKDGIQYDIVATTTVAATTGGVLVLMVDYVEN